MSRYWSDQVAQLEPYVPGEQPSGDARLIKLNTNENPYGPSPKALAAMGQAVTDELRLYPDPEARILREALAAHFGLGVEQVFVGNGSDEVLAHSFNALLRHHRPLLLPTVTYSFYTVYCGLYGIDYHLVPLDENYRIDVAAYRGPCGGVVLANPNAPTGQLLPLDAIAELATAQRDCVVVVDEAYIDFGGHSAVALVNSHPNLLVVQTFSKSRALAGLRVGFALAQRPLIEALERVKNSFNSYPLGAVAQAGAVAALQDHDYFQTCRERVISGRERLHAGLEAMGFEVLPSSANFVFARHPRCTAVHLLGELRRSGVIVRHFEHPGIDQFLRISVGTDAQHEALFGALAGCVPDSSADR